MLADIQKLTDILAIDADGRFSPEDRAAAIELALFRYSSDRPRAACETVEFDGSAFLSMPDGWQKDFSRVLEIKTECGKRVPFETVPSLSGEKILLSGDVRTGDVLTVVHAAARRDRNRGHRSARRPRSCCELGGGVPAGRHGGGIRGLRQFDDFVGQRGTRFKSEQLSRAGGGLPQILPRPHGTG